VDAIALDINFVVRTLFAVLRHIFIYSYLRQKSLLKLSGSACCTLTSGACHTLQEPISGCLPCWKITSETSLLLMYFWPNTPTSLLFISIANIVISSEIVSLFRNSKRRCLSISHAPFSFHHNKLVFPHQTF